MRHGAAGYAPRAKVAPFVGGNGADVRLIQWTRRPEASFSDELEQF
jgi:hypothetical protein